MRVGVLGGPCQIILWLLWGFGCEWVGGRLSFEAVRAALAFLVFSLSTNSCAIFPSSSTVAGRTISIAVKSVAFGAAFAMAIARGPKGEILLGSAGLLESLRKGTLVAGCVEVVIIGGVD